MDSITAIVLCGGLGTRLGKLKGNKPKPMLNVADRPFLEYILDYLIEQGVNKVVLAVSFKKEHIISHFGDQYKSLAVQYSIEDSPLGTGGAIKQAITICNDKQSPKLVINGDTLVEFNLASMYQQFRQENSRLVMSIKQMSDTARYGRVSLQKNTIIAFEEKKHGVAGFINTGVYLLPATILQSLPASARFSFEKDYLEQSVKKEPFFYSVTDGYFIDIGIPEDFYQAEQDFSHSNTVLTSCKAG